MTCIALQPWLKRDNNDNDDSDYINCVRTFNNAITLIPVCEAFVANPDRDDGNDNVGNIDVNDLVRCRPFTKVSYTSTTGLSTATSSGPAFPGATILSENQSTTTRSTVEISPLQIAAAACSAAASLSSVVSSVA